MLQVDTVVVVVVRLESSIRQQTHGWLSREAVVVVLTGDQVVLGECRPFGMVQTAVVLMLLPMEN
tara:strand:- start:283 stop:477 length:195 start_codon:yes stop_codon:yes gene_type:complete